jgi:hypothetical protein
LLLLKGYADNSIQQEVVIRKEVQLFTVGKYSKILLLLTDQWVFKGVFRRVYICTKIVARGAIVRLLYGALGDLTFDSRNWKWNR